MATWRRDRIITIWENAADDRTHRDNEQEEGSIARPRIAQAPTREGPRINDLIEVPRVRLIDENGEQVGIVPVREALAKAQAVGLDLVEISPNVDRSEEHTSELQSLMRISYAVFCLKKK